MELERVKMIDLNGNETEVQVITYLISDDGQSNYLVYTKGETQGAEQDKVIYISKLQKEGTDLKLSSITNDEEWSAVQILLKKIANAK